MLRNFQRGLSHVFSYLYGYEDNRIPIHQYATRSLDSSVDGQFHENLLKKETKRSLAFS